MAKTICLAQSKGGTGKTTSTLNLGAVLAGQGYRVLLVDVDQQANLTVSLGVDPLELPKTMRSLLVEEETTAEEIIIRTSEGLDLIPANLDLAFIELAMEPLARDQVLAQKLVSVKPNYDFVLIDTPPNFSLPVTNAMTASDYVLVPVQPEPLCVFGLSLLVENLQKVKRKLNPSLVLLGLFITLYDNSEAAHVHLTERLRQDWPDFLMSQTIRDSALNDRTVLEGRSIVNSRPRSALAHDYQALTEEVLKRVKR
ncbi:MAG: ParA family protein [Chloroflexi bacterium]|nr:ParA family protein [Chloroflexota bacterium]